MITLSQNFNTLVLTAYDFHTRNCLCVEDESAFSMKIFYSFYWKLAEKNEEKYFSKNKYATEHFLYRPR